MYLVCRLLLEKPRPHPPPPLFPYTTLFRSAGPPRRSLACPPPSPAATRWPGRSARRAAPSRASARPEGVPLSPLHHLVVHGRARSAPAKPDRKSTRLNSSHRCISYAVFCLKNHGHTPRLHSFPTRRSSDLLDLRVAHLHARRLRPLQHDGPVDQPVEQRPPELRHVLRGYLCLPFITSSYTVELDLHPRNQIGRAHV